MKPLKDVEGVDHERRCALVPEKVDVARRLEETGACPELVSWAPSLVGVVKHPFACAITTNVGPPLCGLGHVQGWRAAEKSAVIGHERAIGYLTKYLTGKHPPEFLRTVSGPVITVSRSLTRKTGVTMQMLRKIRRLWSARQGRCEMPKWSPEDFAAVAQLLDSREDHARAF